MSLLHLCAYPGCSEAIPIKDRYCAKHKNTPDLSSRNHSGKSASARGYNYAWRKASSAYLRAHPLCAECERHGLITQATCVDHIKPWRGDRHLFWDKTNWQPLCARCHSLKTVKEDGGFGNARR